MSGGNTVCNRNRGGVPLQFETDRALFSPDAVDAGTLAMLSEVELSPEDKLLDLGCGYGATGILAGRLIGPERVVLCDISERAAEYARRNAERNGVPELDIRVSDGLSRIPERGFTLILSNPPYHPDFSVAKRFIEGGFQRLALGGRMVMVTKRLDWYKNKLTAIFGGVRVSRVDGYYVLTAKKRTQTVRPKRKKKGDALSRKLRRKRERSRETGGGREKLFLSRFFR